MPAAKASPRKAKKLANLRIDYEIPAGKPAAYANNLVIQQTPTEVVLSFYQVIPPVIVGPADEVEQKLHGMKIVTADLVARIAVSHSKMREFADVITRNLTRDHEQEVGK